MKLDKLTGKYIWKEKICKNNTTISGKQKYTVSKHIQRQQLKWCSTGTRNIKKFNATE